MRIPTLLQKISDLAVQPERRAAIDVDLMLDYTRVLYADLLEWRSKFAVTARPATMPPINEPTLSEMAGAMEEDAADSAVTEDRPQPEIPAVVKSAEQPVTSGPARPAAHDIRSLIGINDKYQIMSELFGNDKTAYEDALHYINASGSEADALKWLQEQLWVTEERSDAAQSFYDLVRRFKSGERGL